MTTNLKLAINASLKAGIAIMEVYQSNFEVETKEDASPLTIADKKANDIIVSILKSTNLPIISEETKVLSFETRADWDLCWIVDPLDGTKEFINRNGEFTVNIALVENNIPVLGVIYVPVSKELFFTDYKSNSAKKVVVDTSTAELDDAFIQEKATELHPLTTLESPVKIVGSRSHLNQDTQDFIDSIKQNYSIEMVPKGSSLKFCMVAEGKAHYYPRFAPTMEWDTAAGQAICEAVGVSVINNETKRQLQYNKESLLNPYFLVSNSKLA